MRTNRSLETRTARMNNLQRSPFAVTKIPPQIKQTAKNRKQRPLLESRYVKSSNCPSITFMGQPNFSQRFNSTERIRKLYEHNT